MNPKADEIISFLGTNIYLNLSVRKLFTSPLAEIHFSKLVSKNDLGSVLPTDLG